MRAVQYREIGRGPEVVDVPTPSPRPGEVLVKVTAAGLCHSDWFLMDLPADRYSFGLPLTLGHEGAGRVVALDVDQEKLRLATEVGAQHVAPSGEDAPGFLRELSGGAGAAVVLDFVGSPATLDLARRAVAVDGDIQIVGIGGGLLPTGFFSTPYGVRVRAPYWGTRTELMQVLDLARAGLVQVHV